MGFDFERESEEEVPTTDEGNSEEDEELATSCTSIPEAKGCHNRKEEHNHS